MPTGRQELDFEITVTKREILNGVKGDKTACGLQKVLAPVVGETVTVGLDESGLSDPIPWATWEAIEPSSGRTRKYDGELTPADLARRVITTNDTAADRGRLASRWPEEGVKFTVCNVISRYKQPAVKASREGDSPERRDVTVKTKATRTARKPRRTMRRYVTTP